MSEYTAKGELVYSGEWKNGKRSGKGTEYINGIKVYDGEFSEGVYCGEGRLYEDDLLVYAGSFKDGKKNGYGCKYENGSMVYRGKFLKTNIMAVEFAILMAKFLVLVCSKMARKTAE